MTGLDELARRRQALVALSDAQRALLALELRQVREAALPLRTGIRLGKALSLGGAAAALGLLGLVLVRRRGVLRLASTALAVYPLIARLLAALRGR